MGAEKDVVAEGHAIPDADAVLDGDMVADDRARFDEGALADIAALPDNRITHDMGEGPNARILADVLRFVDPLGVHIDFGQGDDPPTSVRSPEFAGLGYPTRRGRYNLEDRAHKVAGGHAFAEKILGSGVIVRPMAAFGEPDAIRVTVGTREQNERLLKAVSEVLEVVDEG